MFHQPPHAIGLSTPCRVMSMEVDPPTLTESPGRLERKSAYSRRRFFWLGSHACVASSGACWPSAEKVIWRGKGILLDGIAPGSKLMADAKRHGDQVLARTVADNALMAAINAMVPRDGMERDAEG